MTPTTQADDHAELRRRIIESCFELVRSEGMKNLSLRAIADAADTTTQMIYTLYGNKDNLMGVLYDAGSRRLLERCHAIDDESSPEQRLYQIGKRYRDFALDNRELYQAMYGPSLAEEDVVKKTEVFDLTVEILEECFEAGLLHHGDPETVTESFWAGVHGAIGLEIAGYYDDETSAKDAYAETLRAIFDGYRIKKPTTLPD